MLKLEVLVVLREPPTTELSGRDGDLTENGTERTDRPHLGTRTGEPMRSPTDLLSLRVTERLRSTLVPMLRMVLHLMLLLPRVHAVSTTTIRTKTTGETTTSGRERNGLILLE